ncbi:hypothetical protein NUW54_g11344 [Trametes sanguinea]|uniref:Uncharacterized protein n=2 Tax=Trametes sanguinea TaxID=158606 RepID=A0ACC1N7F6_9APHY|nr:hypothetical protein NUW54_g11768 [Trametes sanguinea]KAJ2978036.1 hypothetical protein NUW54_g11344 [Trametes sanguinea]
MKYTQMYMQSIDMRTTCTAAQITSTPSGNLLRRQHAGERGRLTENGRLRAGYGAAAIRMEAKWVVYGCDTTGCGFGW